MCVPQLSHGTCGHAWMSILTPCSPGKGFDNCPLFTDKGTILSWPKPVKVHRCKCPRCGNLAGSGLAGSEGDYCLNEIRMVKSVKRGVKFGRDVHAWTGGVEVDVGCVVM